MKGEEGRREWRAGLMRGDGQKEEAPVLVKNSLKAVSPAVSPSTLMLWVRDGPTLGPMMISSPDLGASWVWWKKSPLAIGRCRRKKTSESLIQYNITPAFLWGGSFISPFSK